MSTATLAMSTENLENLIYDARENSLESARKLVREALAMLESDAASAIAHNERTQITGRLSAAVTLVSMV